MIGQPEQHVETVEAIAVEVARRRMFGTGYTPGDATADNAAGWPITGYPSPVVLADGELAEAWDHSARVLRAWA